MGPYPLQNLFEEDMNLHFKQDYHPPPKIGRSPPKSCLRGDLGGFPGGVRRFGRRF